MFLDPGRNIDQQREAGGVAFGKAVRAETLDLLETGFGEGRVIAARGHAADEFLLECSDGADMAEGCHGAAQAIGFVAGEFRGDDSQLHGLFLEKRDAERFLKNRYQLVLRILRAGVGEFE